LFVFFTYFNSLKCCRKSGSAYSSEIFRVVARPLEDIRWLCSLSDY